MKWIGTVLAGLAMAACLLFGYADAQVNWQEDASARGTLVASDYEATITASLPSAAGFTSCAIEAAAPCLTLAAVTETIDAAGSAGIAATADVALGVLLSTASEPTPAAYSATAQPSASAAHARYGAADAPPVTRGRAPLADDEIAVAAAIARQSGLEVGDVATLHVSDDISADFTVVGLLPASDASTGPTLWGTPLEASGWPYLVTTEGLARLDGSQGAPVVVAYAWDGPADALGEAVPASLVHPGLDGTGGPAQPWPLVGLLGTAALGLGIVGARSLGRRRVPERPPWAHLGAAIAVGTTLAYAVAWATTTTLRDAHAELTIASTTVPPWGWLALGACAAVAVMAFAVVIASGLERPVRDAGTAPAP